MKGQKSLISYAMSFASFLLDSGIGGRISKIILFGSVARGDFSKESDIDIFIDTGGDAKEIEIEAEKTLALFSGSRTAETWRLKGIKNEISLKVGNLKEWSLRREVISSGILLYGKYNEMPPGTMYYLMVRMDLSAIRTARQVSIWRRLYGYRQKIGKKVYAGSGLLGRAGGIKLGKAVILVPMERRKEILDFLRRNRVRYKLNELWSDTFDSEKG